jgi:prophage DNA circulation protein
MTWREDLRRVSIDGKQLVGASFRGVPFLVESSERSGGRRVQVHEFPLRDDPFAEDLGRKARTFRIDGYVIGDDYLTKRDALQVALEDVAGPGEFVDPFHGVKRAMCVGLSVRSTRAEGGIAMFAIEFTETPAQAPTPTEVVDSAEQVADHADVAITAINAEIVEQYDVTGLPAFAIESAEAALVQATEGLGAALEPAVTTSQELAELTGRVALLTAQASSLVRQPAEVLVEFREMITGLVDTAEDAPGAVMDALLEAYGVDLGAAVTPVTSTRERELANQTALVAGLRRVMAIEAARLAPLVPYVSIEEATEARDRVAAQLEEQAAGAEDAAYPALVNLRSGVLRAVPGDTAFARIVTVTRNVATPSLLLAYQLYGSVELELDIVERNNVRHPGFLAGELQVLSEG